MAPPIPRLVNDQAIMIQTRQRELAIVFNQATVDRAPSLLPCPLPTHKFGVLPDLLLPEAVKIRQSVAFSVACFTLAYDFPPQK